MSEVDASGVINSVDINIPLENKLLKIVGVTGGTTDYPQTDSEYQSAIADISLLPYPLLAKENVLHGSDCRSRRALPLVIPVRGYSPKPLLTGTVLIPLRGISSNYYVLY